MIDRSVMVKMLEILDQLDGLSIEENTLYNEVSLKAARPVTTDVLREHVTEAKRKGWIEKEAGALGETRWRSTNTAAAALHDLR